MADNTNVSGGQNSGGKDFNIGDVTVGAIATDIKTTEPIKPVEPTKPDATGIDPKTDTKPDSTKVEGQTETPKDDKPKPSNKILSGLELSEDNAKKAGGVSFDANGNLLDKDGKILMNVDKAKSAVAASKAKETAEAETYTLSEEGDLVNSKGEVLYKKGEFTVDSEGNVTVEEPPVINSLVEKYRTQGYNLKDAEGNDIEFSDDEEGILALSATVAKEELNSQLNNMFSEMPQVKALYQHIKAGGQAEDFYNNQSNFVDYNTINIPKEKKEARKDIVRQYFTKVKNHEATEAERFLGYAVTAGDLDDLYDTAIKGLREDQKNQETARQEEYNRKVSEQQQAQKTYWEEVNKTVKEGRVGNVVIPESDRDAFFTHLSAPVDKEMNSKAQLAYNNLSLDKQLMLDYLVYKDFDLSQMVKLMAATENAQKIKLRKAKSLVLSGNPKIKKVNNQGGSSINLGNLA